MLRFLNRSIWVLAMIAQIILAILWLAGMYDATTWLALHVGVSVLAGLAITDLFALDLLMLRFGLTSESQIFESWMAAPRRSSWR